LIGFYTVEYKQSGKDQADYIVMFYKALAEQFLQKGLKSMREQHLHTALTPL
jgi:hypothetical protein